MTAASKKDAIQIVNNGRSSASYALDIKADATNPGGITATGKAVVKTTGKSGVKDRPIIRFYNGVFTGTNVVYHSGSNGTNCPQCWVYGGVYNGTVYANRALFQFYGGTFNGSLQISVDSSAYALISGGRFKKLSNLYGSELNSDKFTIGSGKGVYDRGVYVDDEGYYVVVEDVITDFTAQFEARVDITPGVNDYLYYSSANEGYLYYTDADMAIKNHTTDPIEFVVAKIDNVPYATLAAALAAVQEGETITVYREITGNVKLPATLKNVTIKGGDKCLLKDMTISAADGNSIDYEGLTFDGITFENSNVVLTGWRTSGVVYKDITVTNCTFRNVTRTNNEAAFHINCDATEAVNGFIFTNNVIDGVSGASNSGLYAQLTGEVLISGNVINNVAFRPYVIQITTDDGIADSFVVTGNTFSGSSVGRAQGLGNNAEGTDNVELVVSENIFKGITGSQQICYWNFNAEKTTADLSKNYYDIDIAANPSKIYYNAAANSVEDLVTMGVYPIYTELNANGTINKDSLYTPN